MRTRIAATVAALFFLLGAIAQIWNPAVGLTLMLLGIVAAVASGLLMQQGIQRRLIKHERFILKLQRSVASESKNQLELRESQADEYLSAISTEAARALSTMASESAAIQESIASEGKSLMGAQHALMAQIKANARASAAEGVKTRALAKSEYEAVRDAVLTGNADTRRYGASIFRRVKVLADGPDVRAGTGSASPHRSEPSAGHPVDTNLAAAPPSSGLAKATLEASKSGDINSTTASAPEVGKKATPEGVDALQDRFRKEATSRNLEKLVSHMWNVRGEITRPAAMIHRYKDLADNFSASGVLLSRQIEDAADLLAQLPQIPSRSQGAIVHTVFDRVLYCVHATPTFHSNGYAVRTRGIAQGLAAHGRQVRVVGRPGYPWDVKVPGKPARERQFRIEGGVEYVHLPAPGLDELPKGAYIKAATDALVREALEFRPAVIQAASNSQNALIGLIAARRLGIPFVYEVRGLWEITQASNRKLWDESERYTLDVALESLVTREADAISVITRQLGDELVQRGADERRITVIPNAVDVDAMLPLPKDPSHEVVPGLSGAPLVGFAGSLVAYEGLDLLIDAIRALNTNGTPCHLVIAGSGAHESTLKEHARASGLEEMVHFLGRVPQDDVRRLLASLDVVVCPRTSNRVTEMVSPIKPLEAFAAGRVVLMSDVAPQYDLASGGIRAPLFRADDLASLTEQLKRLIDDADVRRDYERRARLWVKDYRTWRGVCAPLLEAHESAFYAHASALESRERPKSISQLTLAVAGRTPSGLVSPDACQLLPLPLDRSQWQALLNDARIDLLVVDADDPESWHTESLVKLFQDAAAANIPTMLISEASGGLGHSWAEVSRFADHIAIRGQASMETYAAADHCTTVSLIPTAIDSKTTPLLDIRPQRDGIAVLADSIPVAQALDVARAHGLRVLSTQGCHTRLPARFTSLEEKHTDFDQVTRSAASAVVVLRESDAGNPHAHLAVTAQGGVEIAVGSDPDLDALDASLKTLMTDDEEWSRRAWEGIRGVHRSSTVRAVFTLLLRAAGIPVDFRAHPTYAVTIAPGQEEYLPHLMEQTVAPTAIVVPSGLDIGSKLINRAEARRIAIVHELPGDIEFVGDVASETTPTFYEDLLIASTFAPAKELRTERIASGTRQLVSLEPASSDLGRVALHRVNYQRESGDELALVVRLPEVADGPDVAGAVSAPHVVESRGGGSQGSLANLASVRSAESPPRSAQKVLIAGHDLKFIGGIAKSLESDGAIIDYDIWRFHNTHDEKQSVDRLANAEVILCEWGLGNAVWYSRHKRPGQRLVVRVHSQEIKTAHLRKINHDAVDKYVFVSELVRSAAVTFHGVPHGKTVVIPNGVAVDTLQRPKAPGSDKTIGFVGVVPQAKRLDIALDVLERVRAQDPEYRLAVKGKGPEDYPWMAKRAAELEWYRHQYGRIERMNAEHPGTVTLEGHGDNMAEWYSRVGVVLSTSDFESFHFTIADGVSSGSRPAVLYWPGADVVYPREWISESVDRVAESILKGVQNPADAAYISEHYSLDKVVSQLRDELLEGAVLPNVQEDTTQRDAR